MNDLIDFASINAILLTSLTRVLIRRGIIGKDELIADLNDKKKKGSIKFKSNIEDVIKAVETKLC